VTLSVEEYDNEFIKTVIVNEYEIRQESYRVYKVVNHRNGNTYRVWNNGDRNNYYTCTCPIFTIHPIACKHIRMILELEGKIDAKQTQ
jgi:hypothetical protein